MAKKQFSKYAIKTMNRNPNVRKCTPSKIMFTEEFALKVCEALKKGEDPCQVFTDNGFSIRVLGRSRISGIIGLWRSQYGLEGLEKRKPAPKPKKHVETASERRERNLQFAISYCDKQIADPSSLSLPADTPLETLQFAAIRKAYLDKLPFVVKDLCAHYGFPYTKYHAYLVETAPKDDEFDNILNPHRRK
ncbi:MAG: HTH domain-containing protein [Bacilli bacterium]